MTSQEINTISYLSPSEYWVFCRLGEGLSCKEVAYFKGHLRSIKTIETHIEHLKKKFDVHSIHHIRRIASQYMLLQEQGKVQIEEHPRTVPKFKHRSIAYAA